MKLTISAVLLALVLALTGCAREGTQAGADLNTPATVQTIDAKTASKMMDELETYILLDVRTQEEYDALHIPGALLLPDYDVAAKAAEALPDKNAVILLYCRSGRRSANAAQALVEMGYTQVYDFGGIIDWPYETVSGGT